MTAADFKQARRSLGLTQTQTAAMFGRTLRQVQNWEAKAVDAMAARLMRAYVAGYRPDDWPTSRRVVIRALIAQEGGA